MEAMPVGAGILAAFFVINHEQDPARVRQIPRVQSQRAKPAEPHARNQEQPRCQQDS
jgi:hypothetical protein